MSLTLNLAFQYFTSERNSLSIRQKYSLAVKHAEHLFGRRVDKLRIGEEFCSHKICKFDSHRIEELVVLCLSLGIHNIEFVFPVIFQRELEKAKSLLKIISAIDNIDSMVLNNWGLVQFSSLLDVDCSICLGRMLPVYSISPSKQCSLLETEEIFEHHAKLMAINHCCWGDTNFLLPPGDWRRIDFPKNIHIFFPYVYMTSARECFFSLCHSNVRTLSCEDECDCGIMKATSPEWDVPVYQIGNSYHFGYTAFRDRMSELNNAQVVYTPVDFVYDMMKRGRYEDTDTPILSGYG